MNSRFLWVNLDKQEYLNPRDFYCSRGLWGTAFTKEEMADAVASLLAAEWCGDLVIFLEENVRD